MLNLNRLVYFAAVVEAGSFTAAARRLNVAKTVVSQHVARLEAELDTNLLARTTRRVQPTEAGRSLYSRAAAILREAEAAQGELTATRGTPKGLLRITAPNDFGAFVLARFAAGFCQRYPLVKIDLVLNDARLDLIESEIDVAVRVGWLDDSSYQARRVGGFEQLAVASPAIAAMLPGDHPRDLAALPFIANAALRNPVQWSFTHPAKGEQVEITLDPMLRVTAMPAALSAVLADGGFTILPDFLIAEELQAGRLCPLLPAWSLPVGGVHVVLPPARFRPAKVTAFVKEFSEHARTHCRLTAKPRSDKSA